MDVQSNPVVVWNDKSKIVRIGKVESNVSIPKTNSKLNEIVSSKPILVSTNETVDITLKHDGTVANFDLRGYLFLHLSSQHDRYFQVQIETGTGGGDPKVRYKTPGSFSFDTDLYFRANTLAYLNKQKPCPWPTTKLGIPILSWTMPNASVVPLKLTCLHSVSSDNQTYVNCQYYASNPLQDVVISIPIPAFQQVRCVKNTDGDWRYYFKKRILEWSITLIDESNCSGSLEFCIPVDTDRIEFSPVSAHFTSTITFSDVKVVNLLPLRANDPPEFSQKNQPTRFTESFKLV